MLLSELITRLTNAMSEAGNVVVEGVGSVEHTIADGVHRVVVWDEPTPVVEAPQELMAKVVEG